MSVEDTMSQVVGRLTYANFERIENAMEWIKLEYIK